MHFVRFVDKSSDLSEEPLAPLWGLLDDNSVIPLRRAPYLDTQHDAVPSPTTEGRTRQLKDVKLLAPVTPGKLVCVGRNYAEHAAELGNEVPTEPLIFLKPPTAVIGPGAPVVYPAISQRVDHEAELAVVIGRRCRHLQEKDADEVIFGYTVANDVTARDLQKKEGQWTRGKGFDTFAPVGPWIDTDIDPTNRAVRCLVNDEVRQDGNTSLMIFSVGRILAYITQCMTLMPGDLVLTGTPAGVGPVQAGDKMTVAEGLSSLTNPVVSEDMARYRSG